MKYRDAQRKLEREYFVRLFRRFPYFTQAQKKAGVSASTLWAMVRKYSLGGMFSISDPPTKAKVSLNTRSVFDMK